MKDWGNRLGRFASLEIPSRGKRFSLQDRSERSLFLSATVHELKKVCEICVVEKSLRVSLPLFFLLGPAPRIFSKLLKVPIAVLRPLNISLVIYLDDILLTGRILEEILMSRDTLIFLLQHLGFAINLKKSVLKLITTNRAFRPKNRYLQHGFGTNRGKDGKVNFEQQQQIQSINQACSYQAEIVLNSLSKQELLWWIENLRLNNKRSLRQKEPNLVIQRDVSKSGWGAFCNGELTGGKWSEKEDKLHINVLESIAANFAILTFTKGQSNIAILLQTDSKTALSYLLKMGGTHNRELFHIDKSIWSYLLSKQIAISPEYLPSALNVHADWESRNAKDNSEWKLDVSVFQEIVTHMG